METLVRIYLEGKDSFWPDSHWVGKAAGTVFCPHCRNAYARAGRVNATVVDGMRSTDLDALGFEGGGIHIMSNRFIDLIGSDLINGAGTIGRLFLRSGTEIKTHHTVTAARDDVLIRGSPNSIAGLCSDCGRILYSPHGKEYVLRQSVPKEPFFLSWIYAFCTPEFYRDRIGPANLNRIGTREIAIQERPSDNLPLLPDDLSDALRADGKLK